MPFVELARGFMARELIRIEDATGSNPSYTLACSNTREGVDTLTTIVNIGTLEIPDGWEMNNYHTVTVTTAGTINYIQLRVGGDYIGTVQASFQVEPVNVIVGQTITFQQGTEFTIK